MSNYGLTNITRTANSLTSSACSSGIASTLDSITKFIHAGKWIDAQERIAQTTIKMKAEDRKVLIAALRDIALATNDDQIKNQMFRELSLLVTTSIG